MSPTPEELEARLSELEEAMEDVDERLDRNEESLEDLRGRLDKQEAFNKKYLIPLAIAIGYIIGVDLGYFPTPL